MSERGKTLIPILKQKHEWGTDQMELVVEEAKKKSGDERVTDQGSSRTERRQWRIRLWRVERHGFPARESVYKWTDEPMQEEQETEEGI